MEVNLPATLNNKANYENNCIAIEFLIVCF